MIAVRSPSSRHLAHTALMCIVLITIGVSTAAGQVPTSPRLSAGGVPSTIPDAFGGGEVVLELSVDASGLVTRVDRIVATPPYADELVRATRTWRFVPATKTVDERRTAVPAQVLVVGVFRPPSLYTGPAPHALPQASGLPSPGLPHPDSLTIPAYPPTATGDGMVLIEIEIVPGTEPRAHRTLSPMSGFDGAALDAVRGWRFGPSRGGGATDRIFVYAVLGFRTPVSLPPQ